MKLSIQRETHHGLEVFRLYFDGTLIAEFLSEMGARTAFLRLKSKLGL